MSVTAHQMTVITTYQGGGVVGAAGGYWFGFTWYWFDTGEPATVS
ncbi:hypothetical protein [Halomonas huangheensis]|uniref:Uncharacterized protein n=1 Tax=Halomonas huangheensis TaxID=1178482 RepID=W1N3T8_9GAMM|nr:hypothetical protein [Halomonas huangheensis]ERL49801.1 hypothetical protein BJB45_01390 [Halomonas huangheensis]